MTTSALSFLKILLNCLLILIIFHLFTNSFQELIYPYPREYRDGALIDVANQFKNGINPYTLEHSLPHTYIYGVFSPLLLAGLTSLFTVDFVLMQHIITFVCLLILCFLVATEVFTATKNVSFVLASLSVVLLFNSVSLRFEALAVTVTILTLYFTHAYKVLNFPKILLLSVSVIVLYYIKQYFILLFPALCLYFVFTQAKKSLLYLITTTFILGLASFIIINIIFPLYIPETIINFVNLSGGPSTWLIHSSSYVIKQTIDFFTLSWLVCALFILSSILAVLSLRKNKKFKRPQYNITDFNKPLLLISQMNPINNIYFVYGWVAIFFLSFLLGTNGAAYLTYYTQLLPIPLCIFGFSYIFVYLKRFKKSEVLVLCVIALFIAEYYTFLSFPNMDRSEKTNAWKKAESYINKYKDKDIYLSPLFVTEAVKNDWPVYDNGQTDFYPVSLLSVSSQKFRLLSPHNQEIATQIDTWQKNLDKKLTTKKFALIVLPKELHAILNEDYLQENYTVTHRMDLPINFGDIGSNIDPLKTRVIEFWEPK